MSRLTQKLTNKVIEDMIMDMLPSTFKHMSVRVGNYRAVDRGLQRLRKRGVIAFERKGREVIWSKVLP